MTKPTLSARVQKFIDTLPDPAGARLFIERLFEEHARIAAQYVRKDELCANILTLAAYSPLLAETMLQHPEYIRWLERERDFTHMKSKEVLVEELARFAAVNSTLEESVRLARFKRRELLRIYLRDCKKIATLSETTEELSNLADAVLERALRYCYQPLLSRYGQPQTPDKRGRLIGAEMAIVALGKLGSRELNYSSDIDLIFFYSADGETTTRLESGSERVSNKFFFTKLAEAVVKMIGSPFGEGVVFRVDLRLRPRGREGDLIVSLAEAVRYYRDEAQNWERQALVRARAAAGDARIVVQFLTDVRDQIFRPEPLVEALRDVHLAKEKIDSHAVTRPGGYNLKLGQGGIREIEFIVQALQICYGGRDAWLRVAQIPMGLQRLAEKNLITGGERTRLAQAYTFLRLAEHRLQMEHGLQTHCLPQSPEKLELLARRCGYSGSATFERNLKLHRQNVSAIYQRVFDQAAANGSMKISTQQIATTNFVSHVSLPAEARGADRATVERLFQDVLAGLLALPGLKLDQTEAAEAVAAGLRSHVNATRALRRLRDFTLSMATDKDLPIDTLSREQIRELTIIGGASQHFIQILIAQPHLARLLGGPLEPTLTNMTPAATLNLLAEAIANEGSVDASKVDSSFDEATMKLRRCWYEQMIKIGRYDLLATTSRDKTEAMAHLRQISMAQTALAESALAIASRLACAKVAERYEFTSAPLVYTILGLGRLGHCDIDYDSDLDIIFIYSDEAGNVAKDITNREFYARVVELTVQILSTLTRQGALYRVDLRLRPDGQSGLLATSFDNLQQYLSERAAIWELMAYLKLRPVVGDAAFGARVEQRSLEIIFDRSRASADKLAHEVREMRARLQAEKVRPQTNDFKFGAGGMLDVHFGTRYLQLRNAVADPPERHTLSLIEKLARMELLTSEQADAFKLGYSFLRRLDHQVRLQLERPQSILPHNPAQLFGLARGLGFENEAAFLAEYQQRLAAIRTAYLQIVGD